MKLYNTFSKKKEEFVPLKDGSVGIYVCGPTVYDLAHLGHGRAAVSFDIIRRYFLYLGYNVTFVTNFTDIDDKMINRANDMGISVSELADKIIPEYRQDYDALGIMPGDEQPKATEYIDEMIEIISGLEKGGYTYILSDGVYFDVTTFPDYGKLSGQKMDELRAGIRKDLNNEKRNHQDFVLWKFSKPGEPMWGSPWGDGRPGWHIECSAMSRKYLGESFDIHGGGADLIFPHHECEIAQSEAFSGKKFVNYWLHNGFIRVDNEKMSKSLGNFFTLRDIFKKYDPQEVRYLFLQTHYKSPIDFSDALLQQSKNSLTRIHDFMRRLDEYDYDGDNDMSVEVDKDFKDFEIAMNDDFETPAALAVCFDLIRNVNKAIDDKSLSFKGRDNILNFIERVDSVFGVFRKTTFVDIGNDIKKLIEAREEARADKDWGRADEIRDKLLEKGIHVEDSSSGTVWKKI